jgi:hypothetical protein
MTKIWTVREILVNSGTLTFLCGAVLLTTTSVVAESEPQEVPEMDFLEYLGMWEESDEDWQLLDVDRVAENEERSDPVPEGEESTENEDES